MNENGDAELKMGASGDDSPPAPYSPHPIEMSMAPPPEAVYPTFDDAYEAVRQHARTAGYGIRKQRSKCTKDRVLKRAVIGCDRGGTYVSHAVQRHPKTPSRLCGCPFTVVLRRLNDRRWRIEHGNSTHNHEPFKNPRDHPCFRKLTPAQEQRIREMGPNVPPIQIHQQLVHEDPNTLVLPRDVVNFKAKLKKEGYASTTTPSLADMDPERRTEDDLVDGLSSKRSRIWPDVDDPSALRMATPSLPLPLIPARNLSREQQEVFRTAMSNAMTGAALAAGQAVAQAFGLALPTFENTQVPGPIRNAAMDQTEAGLEFQRDMKANEVEDEDVPDEDEEAVI